MKGQDDYTRGALASIPGRQKLRARIEELDQSVPEVSADRYPGDLYLVWKRLPGENQLKIYKRSGMKGQDTLLLDPEKIKLENACQSIGRNKIRDMVMWHDRKYLAVGVIPGRSGRASGKSYRNG